MGIALGFLGQIGGQLAQVSIFGGVLEIYPEMRTRLLNLLRFSFAMQILPGVVLLIFCYFVPPSPRQLAKEGCWPEAKSLLADLHASGDRENAHVLAYVHELEGDVLNQPQVPHPSRELLT